MPSLGYYLSLFTSEWQGSPNLLAFAQALMKPFTDTGLYAGLLAAAFDINKAVGVQLDVLGKILNQPRVVAFTPANNVSPVLDDPTYRVLLKATVAKNQWNGQIGSLWGIWQTLFPGGTIYVTDNQNMSATIILAGSFSSILQDLITNGLIVPRPEGVQYTFTFATLPIFGFDGVDAAYIGGFDSGHWA